MNLLKALIYIFNKNFNCIKEIAKAFLLRKIESNLTFNILLLLLLASTLLLFV